LQKQLRETGEKMSAKIVRIFGDDIAGEEGATKKLHKYKTKRYKTKMGKYKVQITRLLGKKYR